jgi:hypothetical protein
MRLARRHPAARYLANQSLTAAAAFDGYGDIRP